MPRMVAPPTNAVFVIGLGNPLVSDDSVGWRVAERVERELSDRPDVHVRRDCWGGLRLMERMVGYRQAIVVDAICHGRPPGTISYLTPASLATQKSRSAHDVDLPTALAFGRLAGAMLPADDHVHLVGIEAADVINFSEHCTPAVKAAIPRAAAFVIQIVDSISGATSS